MTTRVSWRVAAPPRALLERELRAPVTLFSYPYGAPHRITEENRARVAEAGYRCCLGAYGGTVAYQIEHLSSHQQRMWLREMIETGSHRTPLSAEEKRTLLQRLTDPSLSPTPEASPTVEPSPEPPVSRLRLV